MIQMIEMIEIINMGNSLRITYKFSGHEPEEPFYIDVNSEDFDLLQIITEIKNNL
jgi:hypothetical protein